MKKKGYLKNICMFSCCVSNHICPNSSCTNRANLQAGNQICKQQHKGIKEKATTYR